VSVTSWLICWSISFSSSFLLSCSKVHAGGQKFVVIVDPGILAIDPSWNDEYKPYTDGIAADVFIRDGFTGAPYMSQV
jgi:hypothetical protein